MPKQPEKKSKAWIIWLVVGLVVFFVLILPILFIVSLFAGEDFSSAFGNVALIELRGVITVDGSSTAFGEQTASSTDIVSFIEDADEDPSIKAIVIDINSPGGSAVASDEIAQALKRTDKPTVAFVREIGTSGAYWVASAADTIIANKMSVTGSIGVIASYLEFTGLMEKYGVSYERLVAGKHKDIGTPFKQLTDEERLIFQRKLDKLHDYFIEEVAVNRGLEDYQVRQLATGEFFLGEEAQQLGLVDVLGDEQVLVDYLTEQLNVTDVEFVEYRTELSFLDILAGALNEEFFYIGKGIGKAFTEQSYNAPQITT